MASYDVAVVGSGVIGLSTAWRLASFGVRVGLFDPNPGRGASYVAAGMLAPVTEAAWGEETLVELNIRSAGAWDDFARTLREAAGYSLGYRTTGTLLIASDRSDRAQLEELLDFQRQLGLNSSWCSPSACRDLEPLLAPGLNGGIFAPQDHQIDNRRLLAALDVACARAGVVRERRRIDAITTAGGRVDGIVSEDEPIGASTVIVAAGLGTNAIAGLPSDVVPPIRPVKGQILRLRSASVEPFLERCVRGLVRGASIYVVAREDGRVAIGATVEERTDTAVTAGGVYALLRDATRLIPGLSEIELLEANAGLRPGSPDNAPMVGPAHLEGLVYATGHYRNGILLAPITADAVSTLVLDGELPVWAKPFDPSRFTTKLGTAKDAHLLHAASTQQ